MPLESCDEGLEAEDRLELAASAQPSTSDDDDPMQEVARRRMHAALVDEVERLPDGLRSVFMMQAIEGVATAEVCEKLNITEANVWVRLHRARKRLAERLEDHLVPA